MKRILATLVLTAATVAAMAQFNCGVHAGLEMNTATPPAAIKGYRHKQLWSPTLGFMAGYGVCRMLDVQAELDYSMRGFKDDIYVGEVGESSKTRYMVRSSYLELPVILKFFPFDRLGLNIQAGPQVGVLLGRGVAVGNGRLDKDLLIGKNRAFDYGVTLGAGVDHANWCLDMRYYLGLARSYQDWNGYRNRGLQLTLGYYFRK